MRHRNSRRSERILHCRQCVFFKKRHNLMTEKKLDDRTQTRGKGGRVCLSKKTEHYGHVLKNDNTTQKAKCQPDTKESRRNRLRRSVTSKGTRFGPVVCDDDEEKWEHPLIRTGKFLNMRKQRSLACCSESKGAVRVRSVMPNLEASRNDKFAQRNSTGTKLHHL